MPNSIHSVQFISPSLLDFLFGRQPPRIIYLLCRCDYIQVVHTKVYFSAYTHNGTSFHLIAVLLHWVLVLIISDANASFNRSNDNLIVLPYLSLSKKKWSKSRARRKKRKAALVQWVQTHGNNHISGTSAEVEQLPLPDTLYTLSIDRQLWNSGHRDIYIFNKTGDQFYAFLILMVVAATTSHHPNLQQKNEQKEQKKNPNNHEHLFPSPHTNVEQPHNTHNDHNHIITHLVILFISTKQSRAPSPPLPSPLHSRFPPSQRWGSLLFCNGQMRVAVEVPFVHLVEMIFPAFIVDVSTSAIQLSLLLTFRTDTNTFNRTECMCENERMRMQEWIELHIDIPVYINRWSLRLYCCTFAETILTSFNSI